MNVHYTMYYTSYFLPTSILIFVNPSNKLLIKASTLKETSNSAAISMWNKIISVDQPAVPIPKSLLNTAYGHTDPSIKGDVNKHSTVRKITGLSMESPQPCGHNLLPWPHRGCVQHCPLKAGKLKSCTVSAEKPQNPSTSDPWKKGGQEHCTSSAPLHILRDFHTDYKGRDTDTRHDSQNQCLPKNPFHFWFCVL